MRRLALLSALLPAFAHADRIDLADREATRAALLRGERARGADASARHKPDTPGPVDLDTLRIRATLPAEGLPQAATFDLALRPVSPFGGVVSLLAIDWRPLEVLDADTGASLVFEDAPDAAEVLVRVDRPLAVGETLRLTITAALEIPCTNPAQCQVRDTPRHLVQFGWYPADFDAPLDDRLLIELALDSADGAQICTTGEPGGETTAMPGGAASHRVPSTLPGFAWGPLATTRWPAQRLLTLDACALPGDEAAAERLAGVARDAFDHHAALFGPRPFDRLTLAEVVNGTGGALSPLELILMPRFVWTRNGAEDDALRDALMGHEVTHQYFFNAIGVTTPADAWLSEGMAEYAACRFQEARTGDDAAFRLNYWGYVLGVPSETDAPLASEAASSSRDAFEILYQKGSIVLRRLEQRAGRGRMDAFLQRLTALATGQILTTEELVSAASQRLGGDQAAALVEDLQRVDVTVIEAAVRHGRGTNDPARLSLAVRPRRGDAEVTPIALYDARGEAQVVAVRPDAQGAPVDIAADVHWLAIDPGLETFRRVKPQPAEDVNLTGVVDGMDLLDVLAADGRRVPGADWDDRLDTNADERVDTLDAEGIADAFGRGW